MLNNFSYLLDLVPYSLVTYFLFSKVKKGLKGVTFLGDNDALDALNSEIARLTSEDYKNVLIASFTEWRGALLLGGITLRACSVVALKIV